MKRRKIVSSDDLARGINVLGDLDLKIETCKARRHARWHSALAIATLCATCINFLPAYQSPSAWLICASLALWLARTRTRANRAIASSSVINESASQLQALSAAATTNGQPIAYKHSSPKPCMTLTVVHLTRQNVLRMVTYTAGPDTIASAAIEDRQVYVKAWLAAQFDRKWQSLAEVRGISTPRLRPVSTRQAGINS